jgi:hypothetical protein
MQPGHNRWCFLCILHLALALLVLCIEHPRCADEEAKGPRVAVAFYGLSRSLNFTLPSIEKYVFEVLDRHGIAYDVFWSGMDTSYINNKRSNEMHMKLDTTEFMMMRPCVLNIVSQSVIIPSEFKLYMQARAEFSRHKVDMFHDNLQSVKNLLGAFHSLHSAHSLIKRYSLAENITYDAVIVLRPDTAVLCEVDIAQHLPQMIAEEQERRAGNEAVNQSIWIPDFGHATGHNDRAAYGSPSVMSLYMTRGAAFRDHAGVYNVSYINGETFLKFYLGYHKITVQPSALRLVRVRVDSSVPRWDTVQKEMNMNDTFYHHFMNECLYRKREIGHEVNFYHPEPC